MSKNYDPACFTLAEHFLQERPDLSADALATLIQTTIEDWMEYGQTQDGAVDPTTTEFLNPRGNNGVVDNEICFNALLLVGDTDVTEAQVAAWSQEDRHRAYDWAMRVYLNASDNDDVPVPPRPDYIGKTSPTPPPQREGVEGKPPPDTGTPP